VTSGNHPNVRGAVMHVRDNLAAEPAWSAAGLAGYQHDMSFDLFGTLHSVPAVTGFDRPHHPAQRTAPH
jgi:hypothetical protein